MEINPYNFNKTVEPNIEELTDFMQLSVKYVNENDNQAVSHSCLPAMQEM